VRPTDRRRAARRVAEAALAVGLIGWAGCKEPEPAPHPPPRTPAHSREAAQRLPTATIRIAGRPVDVEVADEPAERQKGMMYRRELGPDELMLFVFPRDHYWGFYMRNTWVDLDCAYVRYEGGDGTVRGTVVQIEHREAYDPETVYARELVRYVLEAPAGWFAARGIGVGARVEMPTSAVAGAR
jgi:uncharacterized membrane protein (UPF0127 family)